MRAWFFFQTLGDPMKKALCLLTLCLTCLTSFAGTFPNGTQYNVCFTPGRQCARLLSHYLYKAKHSIYVQAYTFTSWRLARSLARAEKRGVKVYIILDKANFNTKLKTKVDYFTRYHIPVWEDSKLNIAHNKVMIIDQSIVETGSYNFTISAEKYNAENMLIIKSKKLAKAYLDNWERRQKASTLIDPKKVMKQVAKNAS